MLEPDQNSEYSNIEQVIQNYFKYNIEMFSEKWSAFVIKCNCNCKRYVIVFHQRLTRIDDVFIIAWFF